ncbi:tigger transposable element-derived protein 4-like [Parasteatoda tepidariorum]|uniref:tigger transposable element-derived protein 4-like n=1 Tax=Parasteatoda tepidariorum TaxID=114398 RepID=UPI001C71FED8|nr:tigger transposable element-derived protein 4-like [Parasteatoda tepidariorum]
MSRKQQSLSLETKQKILNEVCDGILKKTEIATKYGIPNSTLSTIIKNREKIEVAYAINQFEPARKRMRTGGNEEIEVALLRWVREARSQNLPLTGHVLQEKAKVFADALGVTNFASSNGWLTRFKKRHGIVCHKICGEEATVDKETVESFLSEKWPALRKNYAPRDIFNADETGLFFKALPSHEEGPEVQQHHPHSYKVKLSDESVKHVHVNKIRKYHPRSLAVGVIFEEDSDLGGNHPCPATTNIKFNESLRSVYMTHSDQDKGEELRQLLMEYEELFTGKVKIAKVGPHRIRLKPNTERKKPYVYRIPEALKRKVDEQIEELLRQSLIEV